MSIRKQFLKTKPMCKVTFKIPHTVGNGAENAHVVGEFNDWSTSATPMKRLKNGAFRATVGLEKGGFSSSAICWDNRTGKTIPNPTIIRR